MQGMESPPDSPAGNELRSPFGSASFPHPGLRLEIAVRFPHRPLKRHQQQLGLPTRFSEEACGGAMKRWILPLVLGLVLLCPGLGCTRESPRLRGLPARML